jgi:hypothetical protein
MIKSEKFSANEYKLGNFLRSKNKEQSIADMNFINKNDQNLTKNTYTLNAGQKNNISANGRLSRDNLKALPREKRSLSKNSLKTDNTELSKKVRIFEEE